MRAAPLLWAILVLGFGSPGCERGAESNVQPARLTVLAAASLADAFREIGAGFEGANPGVRVEFSFGGSNALRTQLENGSPGDVFASADRRQMDLAARAGVVYSSSVQAFAENRLAVIVPKANRAGIESIADLARAGVKVVVADRAVPVGNYTRLMLDEAARSAEFGPEFVRAFDANTVSREENVAAIVAKVALDEADAGVAYVSDAAGSRGARMSVIAIPRALDQRAEYTIGVSTRALDAALARRFIEWVGSREGMAILEARGFARPEVPTP